MTSRFSKKLIFSVTIFMITALAACGGDGEDSQAPQLPAVEPTSVSGMVAKGIVAHAKVLVCRISNGIVEVDSSCAEGTTGSNGSFTVSLVDGFTGPAMVKVIASEKAVMLDETTGTFIPYDMTMRSVVPSISTTSITYVTPFSEMATSWTRTTGNDAAGITLAIGQVQQLISKSGVDLMVKPVIDLQTNGYDPVMLGKQANMVKQLARVTMMAKRAPELNDSSGGVHCNTSGTTTTQQLACVNSAMSAAMTRGANAAAQSFSRIVPAMMGENPTSIAITIIKPDGTLGMDVVNLTSATSMESAMRNAGMDSAVVTQNVQIMMLQMR